MSLSVDRNQGHDFCVWHHQEENLMRGRTHLSHYSRDRKSFQGNPDLGHVSTEARLGKNVAYFYATECDGRNYHKLNS